MDEKVTICLHDGEGLTNLPILVINDKVISEGKVLREREITKYLKNNH